MKKPKRALLPNELPPVKRTMKKYKIFSASSVKLLVAFYAARNRLCFSAGKIEEQKPWIVFHTDQGAVYSSKAFRQAHIHHNILRSMSRGGTPTDNPVIEALNGWIKDKLVLDFGLNTATDVPALLDQYVHYFNYHRCAAALGYKSPVQYKTELGF